MRLALFSHSIVSDWNHGNAHFQRGILRELVARGHDAFACERADSWSRQNLLADRGPSALASFEHCFPELRSCLYRTEADLDRLLDGVDVVIVHEWTEPAIIAALGRRRARGAPFVLLFHDTHHRAVSAPAEMAALPLDGYDAVLAFGEVLSEIYRRLGWGRSVFTWHEGADVRLFEPLPQIEPERDLVWIGNWGDGERSAELREFLIEPVRALGLHATVHGVRYPEEALRILAASGLDYEGWLPNSAVPLAFARHRLTVHVPRRFYVDRLPGLPTIRMFEALACGIPLVSAPWRDVEGLFRAGEDYLTAESGEAMQAQLRRLLSEPDLARSLRRSGRQRILERHTCGHRVDELLAILGRIAPSRSTDVERAAE
jgi:spore maturation protein CgeB